MANPLDWSPDVEALWLTNEDPPKLLSLRELEELEQLHGEPIGATLLQPIGPFDGPGALAYGIETADLLLAALNLAEGLRVLREDVAKVGIETTSADIRRIHERHTRFDALFEGYKQARAEYLKRQGVS